VSDSAAVGADELDLRDLAVTLWKGRWLIGTVTAAVTVAAVIYALLAQPVFRSEALLQVREEQQSGRLGALTGPLGGLAQLAGFAVGGGADRAVALATLQSRAVIEPFLTETGVLPKLYSSRWDVEAGRWKGDPETVPTVWEAYNDFMAAHLKVSEDAATGLVTVAVEWKDPEEAQRWVEDLIRRSDAHLKAVAIHESEGNLAYLEAQAKKPGPVELQQSVYGLVETELKRLMLAKGGGEYALKTIDRAVVPKKRSRPKRKLIVILGFGLGLVLGAATLFARNAIRSWPARTTDR
jgi:uncharacterized protein involved in exopolysaccharide biosynthesis